MIDMIVSVGYLWDVLIKDKDFELMVRSLGPGHVGFYKREPVFVQYKK